MKTFLKNACKYAIEEEKLAVDNPFDFTDADCGLIDDSITIYPADKEKRIKAKNGFIFINNQGHVCSAKNIEDLFSRAVDSYNSEMNCNIILKPHICRHTFASILASNNCNRAYLQRLLGHNDYKTTDKFYIQFETNTFISDCLSECNSML